MSNAYSASVKLSQLLQGGVAVTKALKILALSRLAQPPAPPPNLGTLVDLTTKSAKMRLATIDDETNIFWGKDNFWGNVN